MFDMKKIGDIPLDLPLGGSEELDPNYISRIRSQYLFAQSQMLMTQMQFADAKAAVMVTLVGVVTFRGPINVQQVTMNDLGAVAFMLCVFLSALLCIIAVIPRYPSADACAHMAESDRWSWPALTASTLTPQDYAEYMHTSEASQLIRFIAVSNGLVAKILLWKFRLLRAGFLFGLLALVALMARAALSA
ncbi:MAG: hypothetical protein AAGF54_12850 [Pseudomonadota bacterium]